MLYKLLYMKYLKYFFVLALVINFSLEKNMLAQDNKECKVLQPGLTGEYKGGCKKGLANGVGEAIGNDRYSGTFKKGYAHGKGIYYYATGAVYEGSFSMGKRNGYGILTYTNEGELRKEEGLWEKDNYIGKKPEPAYEITMKQNILRYSFVKTTDPRPMVMLKIVRNGVAIYPDNLMLSGNSGSTIQQKSFTGFEQLQFPFSGSIKYSLLTPFNNSYVDYELHFTIRESGSWEITLSH